jgi:ssDNA-binding Zn-finger/Zn-ribbon topoisomerase 1
MKVTATTGFGGFLFLYIMGTISWARWATEKEVADFWNFVKKDNGRGVEWLNKNKDHFIDIYAEFCDKLPRDRYNRYLDQMQKRKEYHEERQKMFKDQIEEYDKVRNSISDYGCHCGGQLRIVNGRHGEFISCTNWMDKTKQHVSLNKPSGIFQEQEIEVLPFEEWMNLHFDVSKLYINEFKSDYNVPKYVRMSDILEFCVLNDLPILSKNAAQDVYKAVESSRLSKKREKMTEVLLSSMFEKYVCNKWIRYRIDGEHTERMKRPDFIGIKGNLMHVIEQKKNTINADESQLDFYIDLIKMMYPEREVIGYFLFEEIESDSYLPEKYKSLTHKTIQDELQ